MLLRCIIVLITCHISFTNSYSQQYLEKEKARIDAIYKQTDKKLKYYDIPEEQLKKIEIVINNALQVCDEINWQNGRQAGLIRLGMIKGRMKDHKAGFQYNLAVLYSNYSLSSKERRLLYESTGENLGGLGLHRQSIQYYHKVLEENQSKNNTGLYHCYGSIAYQYLLLKNYKKSDYYNKLSLEKALKSNDCYSIIRAYNDAGWCKFIQHKHTTARNLYRKGLLYFQKSNCNKNWQSRLLQAMLYRNIAIADMDNENELLAIKHLDSSTMLFEKVHATAFFPRNMLLKAECHFKLNNYDEAKLILDEISSSIHSINDRLHYQRLLLGYFEYTNQYKQALKLYSLQSSLKDSVLNIENQSNMVFLARLTHLNERNVKQQLWLTNKAKQEEKNNKAIITIIFILLIVAISVIAFLLFKRFRFRVQEKERQMLLETRQKDKQIEIIEEEGSRLKQSLNFKNQDLTNFAILLSQNHDFVKELEQHLKNLYAELEERSSLLNPIIQLVKDQLLTEEKLLYFQENVDKVNHEFIKRLKHQFPELTMSEIQLCSLLKLQLSTKEIALLKNISAESVKTLRYRLRKKMNLDHSTDLNLYFLDY